MLQNGILRILRFQQRRAEFPLKCLLVAVIALCGVISHSGRAGADASDDAEVGIIVGTLEVLTTSGDINFGTASGIGYTSTQSGTISVKRNTDWKVTIKATTASWTGTEGGRADKPCSDLEYKGGDVANWTELTTTAQTIKSAALGSYSWTMEYRAEVVWEDTPGTYTLTVEYTLTSQ